MPLRMLFVFSLLFNVIFIIIIHNFVVNDTYLKTTEHYKKIETLGERAIERACSFSIECSLKVYAKEGDYIKQTFEKTLNKEKVEKKSILESIKSPIKKLIAEADIKSLITKTPSNSCIITDLKDTIICEADEIVGIFKAEDCQSCLETFRKEFKSLEKKHYKSLIIKLTHRMYNFFSSFFKSKNLEPQNFFDDKLKEKIEDLILN
jgi:hypothetical protein